VLTTEALLSGGLRYAPTTGYYLTALQAEIRSLRFHSVSVAPDAKVNVKDWVNAFGSSASELLGSGATALGSVMASP
jgi:hypothetical protein